MLRRMVKPVTMAAGPVLSANGRSNRPFKKRPGNRAQLFESVGRPAIRPLPGERNSSAHLVARSERSISTIVEDSAHHHYVSALSAGRRSGQSTPEAYHRRSVLPPMAGGFAPSQPFPGLYHRRGHMADSHRPDANGHPLASWTGEEEPGRPPARLLQRDPLMRPYPEQGYRSCCLGIIRLADRYGPEHLEAALHPALAARVLSYRSSELILRHGLESDLLLSLLGRIERDVPGPVRPSCIMGG